MTAGVNNSQFHMWRTLFSVAHADGIVTDEEVKFMAHILEDINFSDEQTAILKDDIVNPKSCEAMFAGITSHDDRTRFFDFARDLVWVDGNFASEEQTAMIRLMQMHFEESNVDNLVGKVSLEFEDDTRFAVEDGLYDDDGSQAMTAFSSFRRYFLKLIGGA